MVFGKTNKKIIDNVLFGKYLQPNYILLNLAKRLNKNKGLSLC